MTKMDECVGTRIKMARAMAGMSLCEVEKKSGISASYLSKIERNRFSPQISTLRRIASVIGCDLSYLTGLEAGFEPTVATGNMVDHPAHYQGKHECIDEMIALFGVEAVIHFCMCNVYKYRFRAANKNGKEDLDKADWYMDKLLELEGKTNDQV